MEDKQSGSARRDAPELFVHYRLLREMGRSSLSVVWEAVDAQVGRRVAIKVLAVPATMGMRERAARMEREARVVSRLVHPNLVTIHEVGREEGQPYLVMEYLTGRTLRGRLRGGPLTLDEAARVLDQAAAGLDAVHAAGVIHRDIKPDSFMILPDGTVKLMDFGLARQEDDTIVTQADMMVGSPTYMAPEQISGDAVGPAGDIWALGVILYEMLAGRPPFVGDRIVAVLEQITTADPPPLRSVPPPVRMVLSRALAKNPAGRHPSAGALADDLRAALLAAPTPPPIVPAPPTAAVTSRGRPVPQIRLLIALAVLAGLGLLALAFR